MVGFSDRCPKFVFLSFGTGISVCPFKLKKKSPLVYLYFNLILDFHSFPYVRISLIVQVNSSTGLKIIGPSMKLSTYPHGFFSSKICGTLPPFVIYIIS
jgi:hypothetical protein